MTLGHLKNPPIVEVVCGVVFQPIPGLDPIVIGTYWNQRRSEYPTHALHPALADAGTVFLGPTPPSRVWMSTHDEVFLLQLQADRFYLNWRKREGDYPRFNTHGEIPGILDRTMDEFGGFIEFCKKEFGHEPSIQRAELAKVDHLRHGEHWTDFDELAAMVPLLAPLHSIKSSDMPMVSLHLAERRPNGEFVLALGSAMAVQGRAQVSVLKIESRRVGAVGPEADLRAFFTDANAELNNVFEQIISTSGLSRFGGAA